MNREGNFEEYVGYLGPKNGKKTSEQPVTTCRQRRCDTIAGRTSCLAPNTKAKEIEIIEDTFHLFFDDNIMIKIVDHINDRINETIVRKRL